MSASNDYDRINKSFEHSVVKLQQNLQYLVDNDKVSNQFITMQNLVIKSLIEYQQTTETIISTLELENVEIANGRLEQIDKLNALKQSFEAICLIHGIVDFPAWLNKGKSYLVYTAIRLTSERTISLPYLLKELIDSLSDTDRITLKDILSINFND